MVISLSDLIKTLSNRHLTFKELYFSILHRIEILNPRLKAISHLSSQNARRSKIFDTNFSKIVYKKQPLYGIPIAVKDTILTENLPTRAGSNEIFVKKANAPLITSLQRLGGLILCKTTVPEFSNDIQTFNLINGVCKNPWNKLKTPGGSSGGSAVAISLGMAALGVGTDFSGSIRIPASFTGTCSYKPTEFIIPNTGVIPPLRITDERIYNLSMGFIIKNIGDLLLFLPQLFEDILRNDTRIREIQRSILTKLIANPIINSWEEIANKSSEKDGNTSKKLLILPEIEGLETDNSIVKAISELTALLSEKGFDCELTRKFPINSKELAKHQSTFSNQLFNKDNPKYSYVNEKFIPDAETLSKAHSYKNSVKKELEQYLNGYNFLILPVTSCLPFDHNKEREKIKVNDKFINYWKATISYCTPFSMSGHPVITVPIALEDNLPIGIQIVGKYGDDLELINFGKYINSLIKFPSPPISNLL